MKITKYISLLISAAAVFAIGCKKDNYEAPKSMLTGRVVYQGQPVGLRSGGVQLELWQHGYKLFSKIPVYVDQDGSFSAQLFDGNYKLVLLKGNGPWADNTDSIDVKLNGSLNVDVPVDPYFIITNESFQNNAGTVTASFTLQQVNTTKALDRVKIYLGGTVIVDENNNAAAAEKNAAAVGDFSSPVSISVTIPASLVKKGYLFARVGVRAVGTAEYLYTQPQKIDL